MTPADMRARADWLEKWCEEKTTPAMLRAGADAIEEVDRLRWVLTKINDKAIMNAGEFSRFVREEIDALTSQEPHHD